MSIEIKVCGITNQEDKAKIEKLNVDYMGFINISRSKRNVSLKEIEEFQKRSNNKNQNVLVIEPENAYEALIKLNKTNIFNVQLHSLKPFDVKYIKWSSQYLYGLMNITKVIGLSDELTKAKIEEINEHCRYCDDILFDYIKDNKTGGTNSQIPIETAVQASKIIKENCPRTKITLAGGLNFKYLKEIQDQLENFDRIDLNSGVEYSVGRKKIQSIKKIIKLIKEDYYEI